MSNSKKIKYFGIFLAIFLILVIVSFSLFAISSVFSFVSKDSKTNDFTTSKLEDNIKSLDIDLSITELVIEKGEQNSIETNNPYVKTEVIDGVLYIKDKKQYFRKNINLEVTLTLIDNSYDTVNIKNGAGIFFIESLKTDHLNLKFGAGSGTIDNLEVYKEATIESGVGKIEVKDGEINNLDLKSGIGKFYLVTDIKGKSNINSGIGELTLNLKNTKDNYKVNINKGIGLIKIDKNKVSEKSIGTGDNILNVKGGIGLININFGYTGNDIESENEDLSLIKILEYFKNKDNKWIIVGELESGYFENNIEVKLMKDDEIKGIAILEDETYRYANYNIEDSKINDKIYIKIENINEAQLEMINYIKK